jgi:N-acetylglucosamine kinase-like BadF-type ATPase
VALFLGIDGGGSKTACVVGDQTNVLGRGVSGGSNLVRLDETGVRVALHRAIGLACAAAQVTPSQISRTCMGVAGAARSEICERVRALLAEVISGEICVVGDMVITLQAAFDSGPGVIVIAGTGSIAFGRDAQGQTARAGGWGFAISDEGSGHWIGQRAVASAMRAHEEGNRGALLENILKSLAIASAEELVIASNATPPPDFASLFPAVLQASDAGDFHAREVLDQAGEELVNLARRVFKRLLANQETVPVAMAGGVFRNSKRVRETFISGLAALYSGATVNPIVVDPVEGALALARNGFGRQP